MATVSVHISTQHTTANVSVHLSTQNTTANVSVHISIRNTTANVSVHMSIQNTNMYGYSEKGSYKMLNHLINYLEQDFSNCGMLTTSGTPTVVDWHRALIKI
jgi:hypothetical protein